MINLLPPKEKEILLLEHNKKLVSVLGWMVLIILICLLLVLLSVKYYILSESVFQKATLQEAEKKYQTINFTDTKNAIKGYNEKLSLIRDFYKDDFYFSDALKIISDMQRPKGVYLTNLFLSKNEKDGSIKANIAGFSDTRENLITLKDSIEGVKEIRNPSFSQASWIKQNDITFSLTFDIIKNGN